MKNNLYKLLKKYIIITFIHQLLFFPGIMSILLLWIKEPQTINSSLLSFNLIMQIICAIFVFLDTKKEELPYSLLLTIAAAIYPIFGIILLALLYIEKYNKATA